MKRIVFVFFVLMVSCRVHSQVLKIEEPKIKEEKWEERECLCQILKGTELFLIQELGQDSFERVKERILLRYSVTRGKDRVVKILRNENSGVSNEKIIGFAKTFDYNCLFTLYPDGPGVVVPFTIFTKRNYRCDGR